MKSYAASLLTTITFLSAVSAQQQYTIDPNSVDNSTRQAWCTSQISQCPLICLQTPANSAQTEVNTCDWTSLTYGCVCSNGMSPNVSEFSQTIPYYICEEWGNQCVANCGNGNNACASDCRDQHPCGAQNPTRVNTSTISHTMSKTASAGSKTSGAGDATTDSSGATIYSGFGAAAASSTGGAQAAASAGGAASIRVAALGMGQTFGLLGVVGVLFGGFAVLL